MRLTRCYVPPPLSPHSVVVLPDSVATHIHKVLRLRPGAELTLFDGRGGEYAAILMDSRDTPRARIGEHLAIEREAPVAVALLQCLARGERMDWIVQKATELGVAAIAPVASRHSVVHLDDTAAERRRAHWQSVAIGACEQCGRNRLPTLRPLRPLALACAETETSVRLLLLPEADEGLPALLGGTPPASLALLIGPEGGLAEEEIALALKQGFRPCRLGPRTLRTETAPLAVLAAIQALAGDFR